MDLQHPPSLQRVRAYRYSSARRSFFLACAVALYAYVLPLAWTTAGQPRATAIAQLEAIEAAKPPEVREVGVWTGSSPAAAAADPATVSGESDEFESGGAALAAASLAADAKAKAALNPTKADGDWRAAFEGAKVATEIKGEDGRSLPSAWLPSAFACAALFLSLTLTALFFLLCHWLVDFEAWALCTPCSGTLTAGAVLLIEPVKHRGKAAIVPLVTDSRGCQGVTFQRQK